MKKSILYMVAALGLFASCDPVQSEKDFDRVNPTAEALGDAISFTQYSKTDSVTPQEDGNWIVYETNPAQIVSIVKVDDDGSESILDYGKTSGGFLLSPKRGSSPLQNIVVRVVNSYGENVDAQKQLTVAVPTELDAVTKLLASDAYGSKIWKWDTEFRSDGGVWGNLGYTAGTGEDFANNGNGIWWGATPGILNTPDQLPNAGGSPQGDASTLAYMEIFDDGNIVVYDSLGNQLRSGKYSVKGYDGLRHASLNGQQAEWSLGTLETTAGSIMWPFQINGGGTTPTSFEIMQLDNNHLKLIYATSETGSWSEATWWAFKSESDAEGSISNNDSKSWTWDVDWRSDGGAWGNMGYAAGTGEDFANNGSGIWWACAPVDLSRQLNHSDTGVATGEEDPNAYMTFDYKNGLVTSYDGNGNQIRQGKYEILDWGNGSRTIASVDGSQSEWGMGTLHTDAGSILFPFQINGGGYKPTNFCIMQLNANKLKLVYAADGTNSWGEATWWAFKAKK